MLTVLAALLLTMTQGSLGNQPGQIQEQKPPRVIPQRKFQLKDLQVEDLWVGETDPKTGKPQHKLKSWVMDTDAKRQEGLMFVLDGDIKQDEGMIFVFKYAENQRFWMMNTYIHLDIAYIGADYRIVKMYTMIAHDTTTDYSSIKPAKYVLEMKQGTIKRLGLKLGQVVSIPDKVKAKE
jgi:uncharacterized membrane protein (UPF0127 family)